MSELVEFLQARLHEDERVARAANGPEWETPGDDGPAEGMLYADGWGIAQFTMYPGGVANSPESPSYLPAFPTVPVHHIENGIHAARHDPARALREVEAKRRLLASLEGAEALREHAEEFVYHDEMERADAVKSELMDLIRGFAAAYSDHPDYREEWRP